MAHLAGTVSAREVITAASQAVGDPTRNLVGRPRYKEFVTKALTLMCHEASFDHRYFDEAIPANRIIVMGQNIAGFRNVWIYRGENCDSTSRVRVNSKENYHHGGGEGSFANNNWDNRDDVTQMSAGGLSEPHNLYYYGWDNSNGGTVYLSPQCGSWERIRIEFDGIGHDRTQEEDIRVPFWAEEAIKDYCCMRAYEHLLHLEGKTAISRDQIKHYREMFYGINGSWANARSVWGNMDDKERTDSVTQITRLGWPR